MQIAPARNGESNIVRAKQCTRSAIDPTERKHREKLAKGIDAKRIATVLDQLEK